MVLASVERQCGAVIMTTGENGNQVTWKLLLGDVMQRFFAG